MGRGCGHNSSTSVASRIIEWFWKIHMNYDMINTVYSYPWKSFFARSFRLSADSFDPNLIEKFVKFQKLLNQHRHRRRYQLHRSTFGTVRISVQPPPVFRPSSASSNSFSYPIRWSLLFYAQVGRRPQCFSCFSVPTWVSRKSVRRREECKHGRRESLIDMRYDSFI